MTEVYEKIIDGYNYLNHDLADPRTREYSILLNPVLFLIFLTTYIKFATDWGPRLMKNRQPFNLRKIIIFYNLLQIGICTYLVIRAVRALWLSGQHSLFCQTITFDDTPHERELVLSSRNFFLLKILDLFETLFFVLKKNTRQITSLHISHHIITTTGSFICFKYTSVGDLAMIGIVNTTIHIIMYIYYLLTSIDSEYKKSIWWKKHLTQLQILQFIYFHLYLGLPFILPYCGFARWRSLLFLPPISFVLGMFLDFYHKEYVKKKK